MHPLLSVTPRNRQRPFIGLKRLRITTRDSVWQPRQAGKMSYFNVVVFIPNRTFVSRDGAVVRALASHQCVPGSIPGPGVICGLSLLLVLYSAPRGLSPDTLVFLCPHKHIQSCNARAFLNDFLWTPWCSVGKQITYISPFHFFTYYIITYYIHVSCILSYIACRASLVEPKYHSQNQTSLIWRRNVPRYDYCR